MQGKGLIRVNGKPLKLFAPEILRAKLYEPVLLLGTDKFAEVDIRVRVTGGGHTSQVYAVRQAVCFPGVLCARILRSRNANATCTTDCQGHCQYPNPMHRFAMCAMKKTVY